MHDGRILCVCVFGDMFKRELRRVLAIELSEHDGHFVEPRDPYSYIYFLFKE